jgi:hypothetical protein
MSKSTLAQRLQELGYTLNDAWGHGSIFVATKGGKAVSHRDIITDLLDRLDARREANEAWIESFLILLRQVPQPLRTNIQLAILACAKPISPLTDNRKT